MHATSAHSHLAVQATSVFEGLSYDEYFKCIEDMIGELRLSWNEEQKVKALKLAIQLAKLLADTGQLKLYARKYKLVCDTLDEFGQLVYERIRARARGDDLVDTCNPFVRHALELAKTQQKYATALQRDTGTLVRELGQPLTYAQEHAIETTRNWLLKVASIRELVPRFYTELCMLKIRDCLLEAPSANSTQHYAAAAAYYATTLRRLSSASWGFGGNEPIVAVHCRAYLCRVACKLLRVGGATTTTTNQDDTDDILFDILMLNIDDAFRHVALTLDARQVCKCVREQNVELTSYFDLICAPLQAMLANVVVASHDDICAHTMGQHREAIPERLRRRLDKIHDSLTTHLSALRRCDWPTGNGPLGTRTRTCDALSRAILIHATLRALPPDFSADKCFELHDMVRHAHNAWLSARTDDDLNDDSQQTLAALYLCMESLALALDASDAFERRCCRDGDQSCVLILESVNVMLDELRAAVGANKSLDTNYLRCFNAWLSYANHYAGSAAVDAMLKKLIANVRASRQYSSSHLHSTVMTMIKTLVANLKHVDEFGRLFALQSFEQLFEFLPRDEHKLDATKWILETMRANMKLQRQQQQQQQVLISDRRTIAALSKVIAIMNDAMSLLIADDDADHLSQLVIYFVDKIALLDHIEHLDYLAKCRNQTGNLNGVLEFVARKSLELAVNYRKAERKRGARQNYLNGCLAFAFTTISAVLDPHKRVALYIEGSALALKYMSLSLADYFIKHTLTCIDEQVRSHIQLQLGARDNDAAYIRPSFDKINRPDADHKCCTNRTTIVNKRLLDELVLFTDTMVQFEDHINLKHKLVLVNIAKAVTMSSSSSSQCACLPSERQARELLLASVKRLNIVGDETKATAAADGDDDGL